MDTWPDEISVEAMYSRWPLSDDELDAILDRSHDPKPADSLFDAFGGLGAGAGDTVLDIGARDARHSLELARRFGCRVVAVEPVAANLANAFIAIERHPNRRLVDLRPGGIGSIPAVKDEFVAIWSRDVLSHIVDIDGALRECARVLRPGGAMLVYQTFATPLLEPAEAARIFADLAVVPERMDPVGFEQAVVEAGFRIEHLDVIGSQWREAWEEEGEARTSRQLLHAARLLRCRDELLTELGELPYRVELSNALWGVYQMIGKLEPRIYTLRH